MVASLALRSTQTDQTPTAPLHLLTKTIVISPPVRTLHVDTALLFAIFSCLLTSCLITGCQSASQQDCERIIDRIVELELKDQGITNPELVRQRKAETHARKQEELVKGCVGKRIGKATMACIESAESSVEITEKCLQ
ncbi:MAG: hypothetical protein FWD57_16285 [Polyangiaceae bacterium]|nr:hypothetical protein [Polyangiaceae bacterium]